MAENIELRLVPENMLTQAPYVFATGVHEVDLSRPVNVSLDDAGNIILQDGNHRAKKAALEGQQVLANLIGHLSGDLSTDPFYHRVSDLDIKF